VIKAAMGKVLGLLKTHHPEGMSAKPGGVVRDHDLAQGLAESLVWHGVSLGAHFPISTLLYVVSALFTTLNVLNL